MEPHESEKKFSSWAEHATMPNDFLIFFSGAKLASLMFHPLISRRLKRTGGWEVVFECSVVKREVSREQCNCLISVMTYQLHLLPDLVERSIFAILRTEKNQLALPSVFSPIVFLLLCCCRVTPSPKQGSFPEMKILRSTWRRIACLWYIRSLSSRSTCFPYSLPCALQPL